MSNTYVYPTKELTSAIFCGATNLFILNFGGGSEYHAIACSEELTPLKIKNQVLWAYEEWFRKEKARLKT